MTGLFTALGRRHIRGLLRAISASADALDRSFAALLGGRGHDRERVIALRALTPAAAARAASLQKFLVQVERQGERLANINVLPSEVLSALRDFDRLLDGLLQDRFRPSREQLSIATYVAVNKAFYHVRERETRAFYSFSRAEAEATGLDDLLSRFARVLGQAFHAAAGSVLWSDAGFDPRLARPVYVERGDPLERLVAGHRSRRRCRSYWSYPMGPHALIQLGFRNIRPWLPREQALLAAAAEHCRRAADRIALQSRIRRLETEARNAEQEERRRIGRELHDEAGQAMLLLRLQLEMLERDAPGRLQPRLAEARELAARTAAELRRIVTALGPAVLDHLGLEKSIRQAVARFGKLHAARVRLRIQADSRAIPMPVQQAIYRAAQESLQNIAQHSRATYVNLSIDHDDKSVRLSVADNGNGFSADRVWTKTGSFGLAGMRERAALLGGTLEVRSAPGKGSRIVLELPICSTQVKIDGKDSRTLN